MTKYFDKAHNRLVCVDEPPTSNFWEKVWSRQKINTKDYLVCPETRKYLKPPAKIIEGGCGTGKYVLLLKKLGYDVVGIDLAAKTISKVKKIFPDLPIMKGNVLKTIYKNDVFDGYWSIGVIEHFYNGYGPLLHEIKRILKPKGYLFLTFPYLSPLRKLKVFLKIYPEFTGVKPKNYYQFILDSNLIVNDFENQGFSLVKKRPFDGYHGLREELGFRTRFAKLFFSILAIPFASHSILLVFQKND